MYRSLGVIFSLATLVVTSATWPIKDALGAGLQYSNSLESGFGDTEAAGGCYDYSFTIVDSPVRDGAKSLKVLNKGMENNMNCTGWAQTAKHRAEVIWGANVTSELLNKPYWFGFSMFVPQDYPEIDGGVLVAQWMGGAFGPELSLQIRGGKSWEIRRDWSTGIGDKGNEITQAKIPVEKGVWTDWVVYRERSWNNDGVIKVWKNNVKVIDFVGPTAINYEAHGQHSKVKFKTGSYWGTDDRAANYTLYFDSIRMADVANGYDLVAPSGGLLSAPEAPEAPSGLQILINAQ